jgi:predicted DNA-binding protein with PD1-like motif
MPRHLGPGRHLLNGLYGAKAAGERVLLPAVGRLPHPLCQGAVAARHAALRHRRLTLGYFDFALKDYRRIEIDEQVELVSLLGDFALSKGEPKLHAHVVVAKSDGSAHGGHLLQGVVRPTLEVVLVESPAWLHRETDAATGLPLIRIKGHG